MNDRPEIAVEPGTNADVSRFTPSRPEKATHAMSVSFLDSTGFVVYGSAPSPFASCRRTCSNPSAVIVALPIRWAASSVRCCSVLVVSDAAWAMLFAYSAGLGGTAEEDLDFLRDAFKQLLLNFTWWVNRKDPEGRNLFEGGFLGLDNIGVFDRSAALPTGGRLEQGRDGDVRALGVRRRKEAALLEAPEGGQRRLQRLALASRGVEGRAGRQVEVAGEDDTAALGEGRRQSLIVALVRHDALELVPQAGRRAGPEPLAQTIDRLHDAAALGLVQDDIDADRRGAGLVQLAHELAQHRP